jgi:hypothetical protein
VKSDRAADKAMKERKRAEILLWKAFETFIGQGHPHPTPPDFEQLLIMSIGFKTALEEMTAKLAVSIGEDKKHATESFAAIFDFMKSQSRTRLRNG